MSRYTYGSLPKFFYSGVADPLYNLIYKGANFRALDGPTKGRPKLEELYQHFDFITAEPRMPHVLLRVPAPTQLEFELAAFGASFSLVAGRASLSPPDHGHHALDERLEAAHNVVNLDAVLLKGDFEQMNLTAVRPIVAYSRHKRDDRYGCLYSAVGQRYQEPLEVTIKPDDWGEETTQLQGRQPVIRGGFLHAGISWGVGLLLTNSSLVGLGSIGRIRKSIRGTNPTREAIRARIRAGAAARGMSALHQQILQCIAYQESGFTQFYDDHSVKLRRLRSQYQANCGDADPLGGLGFPVFGPSSSWDNGIDTRGGFGIFQLDRSGTERDPYPQDYELWDWTANVARGVFLYHQKVFLGTALHPGSLMRLRSLYEKYKADGARPFRIDEIVRECAIGFNGGVHGNVGLYQFWDSITRSWQIGGNMHNAFYANAIYQWFYQVFGRDYSSGGVDSPPPPGSPNTPTPPSDW